MHIETLEAHLLLSNLRFWRETSEPTRSHKPQYEEIAIAEESRHYQVVFDSEFSIAIKSSCRLSKFSDSFSVFLCKGIAS